MVGRSMFFSFAKSEKKYETRPSQGDLPGKLAAGGLSNACTGIDKSNKFSKPSSDGTTITSDKKKLCGMIKPISFDNGKTSTGLYCTMSKDSKNTNFNGICNKDNNNYYLVSSK
jgi:hypothetical protein